MFIGQNACRLQALQADQEPRQMRGIVFSRTEESMAVKKRKAGTLKSGRSGKKVTSRKQAIAIGLSEARAKGKKVPKKAAKKRKTAKKTAKSKR
jgi:hypothetical protein